MIVDVEFKGFYNFENQPAWLYGDLIQKDSSKKIYDRKLEKAFGVEENLVGQLVGLDKNDKKIFSDVDIVEFYYNSNPDLGHAPEKLIGVFVFNEFELCYELKINRKSVYTGKKPYYLKFNPNYFSNFKLIGDVVYNKDLIGE